MAIERPHLLIPNAGRSIEFAATGGGDPRTYPLVRDRAEAARRVLRGVTELIEAHPTPEGAEPRAIAMSVRASGGHGVNRSVPGRRNDVLSTFGLDKAERVNVALDPSTLEKFEAAAQKYIEYDGGNRPHHFNFFEARPVIARTEVSDLWASPIDLPQPGAEFDWEVWLQPTAEPRFRAAIEEIRIPNPPKGVDFDRVRIIRLRATREQFERLVQSATISQLRPASSLAAEVFGMPPGIQALAVEAAARRLTALPDPADPAVCIVDTGVTADHLLLAPALRQSVQIGGPWPQVSDWNGHGTQMAGVALYEGLAELIAEGTAALDINLESAAIYPPGGGDTLPAVRLRQAVDQIEAGSNRKRVFCLAMNAPLEASDGSPSSMSGELDALAADVANPRLFCVAAGNLEGGGQFGDYQALNEISGILAPAQAWNALTVAACTDLADTPTTHAALAPAGDLSPWSRTAVNWEKAHRPPSKPDVVFEGGNRMSDTASQVLGDSPGLCLLTTSHSGGLTMTAQTSAATAGIAGMAARLQKAYPRLWPETVRGLIVHSAEHTQAMRDRASAGRQGAEIQKALLQRYGYGRPDRAVAMQNAEDALTLIVQGTLLPLRSNRAERQEAAILGYMRFHELPWPIEVLQELEGTPAEMRVTLSYFVEPNPAAVLTGELASYPSHVLDFDVMRPDESAEDAIARVNHALRAQRRQIQAEAPEWTFGPRARGRGGLKHDRLENVTAADLARMGGVSVFPGKGWWGSEFERVEQQVRYSLIVSIRTPEVDVYSEIANTIEVET